MGSTALKILSGLRDIDLYATINKSKPQVENDNIKWVRVDLTTQEGCRKAVNGMDYVFMFAGLLGTQQRMRVNPSEAVINNTLIYSLMLETAWKAGVKKFFMLSSITGYPEKDEALKEEDFFGENPSENQFGLGWMYRYGEKLAEYYSLNIREKMSTYILRPTTIYGAYEGFDPEKAHFLPSLIKTVIEEKNYEVWGDGSEKRDMVYAEDVFRAFLHISRSKTGFKVYNIDSGNACSVKQIIEIIKEYSGKSEFDVRYDPLKMIKSKFKELDCSRLNRTGFRNSVSMKDGIKRLVDIFKESSAS